MEIIENTREDSDSYPFAFDALKKNITYIQGYIEKGQTAQALYDYQSYSENNNVNNTVLVVNKKIYNLFIKIIRLLSDMSRQPLNSPEYIGANVFMNNLLNNYLNYLKYLRLCFFFPNDREPGLYDKIMELPDDLDGIMFLLSNEEANVQNPYLLLLPSIKEYKRIILEPNKYPLSLKNNIPYYIIETHGPKRESEREPTGLPEPSRILIRKGDQDKARIITNSFNKSLDKYEYIKRTTQKPNIDPVGDFDTELSKLIETIESEMNKPKTAGKRQKTFKNTTTIIKTRKYKTKGRTQKRKGKVKGKVKYSRHTKRH